MDARLAVIKDLAQEIEGRRGELLDLKKRVRALTFQSRQTQEACTSCNNPDRSAVVFVLYLSLTTFIKGRGASRLFCCCWGQ